MLTKPTVYYDNHDSYMMMMMMMMMIVATSATMMLILTAMMMPCCSTADLSDLAKQAKKKLQDVWRITSLHYIALHCIMLHA